MKDYEAIEYPESVDYPLVREILGSKYADVSSEEIESLFYDLYGEDITPNDMEFAWGALISAIPAVVSAVGSIAKMIGKKRGKRRPPRPTRPVTRRPAARPAVRPPVARPAAPQTQAVAAQLLNTLMNPQFLNALMSVAGGLSQRGTVRTSRGESVPLQEYTTVLGVLAEDYQEALALEFADESADMSYYTSEGIDPLIAEDRAAIVQEIISEDNEAFLENFADLLDEVEEMAGDYGPVVWMR